MEQPLVRIGAEPGTADVCFGDESVFEFRAAVFEILDFAELGVFLCFWQKGYTKRWYRPCNPFLVRTIFQSVSN